jgi:hypothetical protein
MENFNSTPLNNDENLLNILFEHEDVNIENTEIIDDTDEIIEQTTIDVIQTSNEDEALDISTDKENISSDDENISDEELELALLNYNYCFSCPGEKCFYCSTKLIPDSKIPEFKKSRESILKSINKQANHLIQSSQINELESLYKLGENDLSELILKMIRNEENFKDNVSDSTVEGNEQSTEI